MNGTYYAVTADREEARPLLFYTMEEAEDFIKNSKEMCDYLGMERVSLLKITKVEVKEV